MLNLTSYLRRIDYAGPDHSTPETQQEIHRTHLFAVPFEKLDVRLGHKIVCNEVGFLHKIVNELAAYVPGHVSCILCRS
jgi:N-hydroxyarylamine O-acetyltransferase